MPPMVGVADVNRDAGSSKSRYAATRIVEFGASPARLKVLFGGVEKDGGCSDGSLGGLDSSTDELRPPPPA